MQHNKEWEPELEKFTGEGKTEKQIKYSYKHNSWTLVNWNCNEGDKK